MRAIERVTLERFYRDPEIVNRIYAQARYERNEAIGRMVAALCAGLLRLGARRGASAPRQGACGQSARREVGA